MSTASWANSGSTTARRLPRWRCAEALSYWISETFLALAAVGRAHVRVFGVLRDDSAGGWLPRLSRRQHSGCLATGRREQNKQDRQSPPRRVSPEQQAPGAHLVQPSARPHSAGG